MLELLTRSKIRRKLILLFIYNRKKEYFLNEIARNIGTSAGTAQRELNKLLKGDLIILAKRGNMNMYKLNTRYSLLSEVESIIRKTIGVEVELEEKLKNIPGISFALLFGSYVKGGFKSDSDIDLFVIGNMNEEKVYHAVQDVEKKIGREINFHLASKNEFVENSKSRTFYKEIMSDHVMIFGDENEFKKLVK
jgi:predicted nucleotidyltransferase